jgi:hypothetical protein
MLLLAVAMPIGAPPNHTPLTRANIHTLPVVLDGQVSYIRSEHAAVAAQLAVEREAARQAALQTYARQKQVLHTVHSVFRDEYQRVAANRVASRSMARHRGERMRQERAFAAAFVRQAGKLSRTMADCDLGALQEARSAATAARTLVHREQRTVRPDVRQLLKFSTERRMTWLVNTCMRCWSRTFGQVREANIAAGTADTLALNKYKAAVVKRSGYTEVRAKRMFCQGCGKGEEGACLCLCHRPGVQRLAAQM